MKEPQDTKKEETKEKKEKKKEVQNTEIKPEETTTTPEEKKEKIFTNYKYVGKTKCKMWLPIPMVLSYLC